MKMKSKFFGLNAKLALAVLAVGTMFTSCYDSENGDVTQPYQAPNPIYTFTGTVINDVTGAPVEGASVSLTGAATANSVKTDEQGTYQFVLTPASGITGTVNVVVADGTDSQGNEFKGKTATIENVVAIEKGQTVIYYKNVVVNYETYIPEGLEVSSSSSTTTQDSEMQGHDETGKGYNEYLDISNESDSPMYIVRTFNVHTGSELVEDKADIFVSTNRGITDNEDAKAAIRNYIINDLGGVDPSAGFTTEPAQYEYTLPPYCALNAVVISYQFETKNYDFTYQGESVHVVTRTVLSVTFASKTVAADQYHGHGHGHGDTPNAGGGIAVPEL